jgi:hypothetical protein
MTTFLICWTLLGCAVASPLGRMIKNADVTGKS